MIVSFLLSLNALEFAGAIEVFCAVDTSLV